MSISIIILLTPIIAYLVAGSLKFILNSYHQRAFAISNIGMGGFPSTHNTITSATTSVIGFQAGFLTVEFLICFMVLIIIAIDSVDLRKKIEEHAVRINKLDHNASELRTRLGHTPFEMMGGIILGSIIGFLLSNIN
tara:strand:- start:307 stop:717 length:411 start_codon:yes stop_codon:yes gene_type:complete